MRADKKRDLMKRRRWRIRKKIVGTVERPRMSVRFTNKNIYVQFIDDEIGKLAGEAAKSAGIETAVFDRSGAHFHGKVKALAEAAREAGLKL